MDSRSMDSLDLYEDPSTSGMPSRQASSSSLWQGSGGGNVKVGGAA